MKISSDGVKAGLLLAMAAGAGFLLWRTYSGAQGAAAKVGNWVNPASDQNLAYQSVNAAGAWLTDDPDYNLGGAIYEVTHDGSLNPASENNWIYRGVNAAGAWITDKPDYNLGGAYYEMFNPEPKPTPPKPAPKPAWTGGATGYW